MRILFKTGLFIIYPFWWLLSCTILGNASIMFFCCFFLVIINHFVLSDLEYSKEKSEAVGGGIAFMSILISPFIAWPFLALGELLEKQYEKYNLPT